MKRESLDLLFPNIKKMVVKEFNDKALLTGICTLPTIEQQGLNALHHIFQITF